MGKGQYLNLVLKKKKQFNLETEKKFEYDFVEEILKMEVAITFKGLRCRAHCLKINCQRYFIIKTY